MSQLFYLPFQPVFNSRGLPVAGAKATFFASGTTTKQAIYADAALTTPLANPVVADAIGKLPDIYMPDGFTYRVRITAPNGAQLGDDIDPYYPGQAFSIVPSLPQFLAPDGSSLVGFRQAGTGAVTRTSQDKLRESVSVFDFGAVGDGVTNDTVAIKAALAALRSGGTLELGNGYTFLLSQTLVLSKPVNMRGSTMEQCKLLFAASGTYQNIGDGSKAAIIVIHPNTVLPGFSGYGGRSSFEGFCISAAVGIPTNTRGIVISAPCYLYEMRVENFTSDGFAVMAGTGSPINGNANGTAFLHCASQDNAGHGYYFKGNDSNACTVTRSYAADCGGWGFYDDSFLGNTYLACEADNNFGGYFASSAGPLRSLYLGCYSETPTHMSLGPRCTVVDIKGLGAPDRSIGASYFGGLPSGDAYSNKPVIVAKTQADANALTAEYSRLSEDGLEFRSTTTGASLKLTGIISPQTYDLLVGGITVLRMARVAVTGNFNGATLMLPGGFVTGANARSGIVGAGAAAPTTGSYDRGAIWLNDAPAASGKIGWVCVTAGSPGTWKTWGAIDA